MKIIIIHGTKGSPEGNWFPWLKRELEARGHEVYVPHFPTPENQSSAEWCKTLKDQAPVFDGDTVLVGHSCGATHILHVLEEAREPMAKTVLVSGFIDKLGNPEYDTLNKTFIERNFNWEKIRRNAGKLYMFHGDNDPYVPLPFAQRLANKLKAPLTIIKGGGHLNAEAGYTEFPEILNAIIS